jgi:hypothetical protein
MKVFFAVRTSLFMSPPVVVDPQITDHTEKKEKISSRRQKGTNNAKIEGRRILMFYYYLSKCKN